MKKYTLYIPYIVFLVSLISTILSLYFSEILNYQPCELCWYQRIFMYPLFIISAANIIKKHGDLAFYILPFSVIGFFVALYQNLLIWHIIPEEVAPCVNGVSCIEQPFTLYGFFTIPFGSMIAFAFITLLMLLYAKIQAASPEKAN